MPHSVRRCWAEISIACLAHNVRVVRALVGPNVQIMVMVKADAYGHGALGVSMRVVAAGADRLGVADVKEAGELRALGIKVPLHILGSLLPSEIPDAISLGCVLTISSQREMELIRDECKIAKKTIRVHIEVDTGMGRLGVLPENALSLAKSITDIPELELEGIYTHFPSADEQDRAFTTSQVNMFWDIISLLREEGIEVPFVHASNSCGLMHHRHDMFNLVRPGLAIYGLVTDNSPLATLDLRPVLSLKTRIVFIKDVPKGFSVGYGRTFITERPMRLAICPVGYNDGYSVLLSNRSEALVEGKRVRVIGRVSMDYTTIDVTDLPEIEEEAVVTLLGSDGDETINASELAELKGTHTYEIVCALGKRAQRVYV